MLVLPQFSHGDHPLNAECALGFTIHLDVVEQPVRLLVRVRVSPDVALARRELVAEALHVSAPHLLLVAVSAEVDIDDLARQHRRFQHGDDPLGEMAYNRLLSPVVRDAAPVRRLEFDLGRPPQRRVRYAVYDVAGDVFARPEPDPHGVGRDQRRPYATAVRVEVPPVRPPPSEETATLPAARG